jgi:hypothetical protein
MIRNRIARALTTAVALASMIGLLAVAQPAQAFTSGSSINVGGNTFSVKAWSCNLYVTACSWDAEASSSQSRTFTHKGEVKANGINVSVTISAAPSVTITGNSTSLATASRTITGTYNYMSGVANPSIFSVSVAAQSRLISGSTNLASGWTTW